MKRQTTIKALVASLALTGLGLASAQDQLRTQIQDPLRTQDQLQDRDRIYRDDLLSEQERNAYIERLRLARTEQERERIRLEHREKMDMRLRAMNQVQNPAPAGSGMGHPGKGQGSMILRPKGTGRQ